LPRRVTEPVVQWVQQGRASELDAIGFSEGAA
jgi:hypothetical protein